MKALILKTTIKASLFLLCPLLINCTSKLTAKFESDTIGNLPNKSLPGSPTGDVLTYASEIESQLKVVSTPTATSQKSLEYKSVSPSGNIGGHHSWLSFKAKSTNFAKPVTFVWTAQKDFSSGGPNLNIDCSDGSGVVAARIKILNNGSIILVNDIVSGTGNNVGSVGNNKRHTIMVTVDLANEVYNISVLKTSGNIIKNGNQLLTSNITLFHNPAKPTVSFKYDTYAASQEYIIDEVFINRKN